MDLLRYFSRWLAATGRATLADLLDDAPLNPVPINSALADFGRTLWREGAPYWRYCETCNAVASRQPLVRRSLGIAWDLAYTWLELEPHRHHLPVPPIVIVALVVQSLLWGWPRVAALLFAGFSGMLRPAEFLCGVTRSLLVLLRDTLFTQAFALMRIPSPKTRGSAGRHQAGRIDHTEAVLLLDAVFGALPPSCRLWPMSVSTFRSRFRALLRALQLPFDRRLTYPRFDLGETVDLGSLRTSGTTWLWLETQDAELVRQRGRWLSAKVMQIYIQEALSVTFLARLPPGVLANIERLSLLAPEVLEQSLEWLDAGVPSPSWPERWAREGQRGDFNSQKGQSQSPGTAPGFGST